MVTEDVASSATASPALKETLYYGQVVRFAFPQDHTFEQGFANRVEWITISPSQEGIKFESL
jgi:hypothetical protein